MSKNNPVSIFENKNIFTGQKNVLFELQYNGTFPYGNYYLQKFNKLPNFFKFDKKFDEKVVDLFTSEEGLNNFQKIHEARRVNEKNKEFVEALLYEQKENLYLIDREYDGEDDLYYL